MVKEFLLRTINKTLDILMSCICATTIPKQQNNRTKVMRERIRKEIIRMLLKNRLIKTGAVYAELHRLGYDISYGAVSETLHRIQKKEMLFSDSGNTIKFEVKNQLIKLFMKNPLWTADEIREELSKTGYPITKHTCTRYLAKARKLLTDTNLIKQDTGYKFNNIRNRSKYFREAEELIAKIALENRDFGRKQIESELAKFGYTVSEATIRRYTQDARRFATPDTSRKDLEEIKIDLQNEIKKLMDCPCITTKVMLSELRDLGYSISLTTLCNHIREIKFGLKNR